MKGKQMIVFFAIVFAVNLLVNLYIFSRTRLVFPEKTTFWWGAAILFWMVAFSYLVGRVLERTGADILAGPFVKAGSWWLGAMTYLTLLFLLADLLRGINNLFNLSEILRFSWSTFKGKNVVFAIYLLATVILVLGYFSAKIPVVRQQSIQLNKPVPGGEFKVVLASDIHMGMIISNGRLNRMVDLINKQNADLVLLAGDVFDEDPGPVIKKNMGDQLKKLEAEFGVFAVLGNHEFYGDAEVAHHYLENHRVTVLRDSVVTLANIIEVIGREDITSEQMNGKPRKSLQELLSMVNTDNPVFLMDHQPFKLAQVAEHKIDLQVSGHTHNGQMWPFNYITSAMFEISKGYGKNNDTHFYVSSGYGTWGPPIRTNSRSEIVVLEILGK